MPFLPRFAAIATAVVALTGTAQQVTLSGLRAPNGLGAFHGVKQDASGNLYTLLAAQDGVRLLKFNAGGTQLLAQVQVGSAGDTGIALDLDPAGNVYVAGTSTSLGSVAGTAGTAFPNRADTTTNSFIARFSPALAEQWLTFCGSGRMAVAGIAATSTSVLITGSIFAATLPVTSGGIQQTTAPGSSGNGFVESFSSASGTLGYATYLTGAGGDTTPAGIATDASGNAYIAGTTTATGYPTASALVPIFRAPGTSNAAGFVTKLDPAGDGFLFSTFVPGGGLTSIAVNASGAGSLLLSGNVAMGLFPLTEVQAPVAAGLNYQVAVRMALDGSSVTSATVLAPGAESLITPGLAGSAWVFADASTVSFAPLLPVVPVETLGNAFALRVTPVGTVDRAARFGGVALSSIASASLPVMATGVTVSASGVPTLVGSAAPTLSAALLTTERYDLPLVAAPNAALASTVRDALPTPCASSACSGSAGVLAQLAPDSSGAALALSVDGAPNLTLRNLGTAAATGVQLAASGYTVATSCGTTLAAGGECSVALIGSGPGSVTVNSASAGSFTTQVPASTAALTPITVLPRELDFGIQTSGSSPGTRTLTVANLGTTTQTFTSANMSTLATAYTLSEANSTCTPATGGAAKALAPGGTCTITLSLKAGTNASADGVVNARWKVGTGEVLVTAYAQAATVSLSATTVDFGRQYAGGLSSLRYLYVSNASDAPQSHTAVTSGNAVFTVIDECTAVLQPRSVCRVVLAYKAASAPSSDAMTLGVDGLTATVLGETLPQPSLGAASANPNLTVSPTSVTFAKAVVVTSASTETQTVAVGNTGATAFPLVLATTGDFTETSNCGSALAANSTCNVVLTFTPSAAGARQGLLSVTAGSTAPVYVDLYGTGTAILPPSNSVIAFGDVPVGTPAVQWFKVSGSFVTFSVVSSSATYRAILVEDSGYGHGQPVPSAFAQTFTGSCLNCYLGVQFMPLATGTAAGTLTLSSAGGGAAETLTVNGNGAPLTGPILTPAMQDFGTVAVHSSSAAIALQLTNGSSTAMAVSTVTVSGDFAVSSDVTGGAVCAGASVLPGASCFLPVRFSPAAGGMRGGTVSVTTSQGAVSSALSGVGADDPGVAFSPVALVFNNVPGVSSTQQTVTVTNTTTQLAAVDSPAASDSHFAVTSTCGALAAGASCTLTVTYSPGLSTASGTVTLPVTTAPAGGASTATYAIALSGLYTSENAGLQVVPGELSTVNFGPAAMNTVAASRVLHVNNTSAKAVAVTVESPREFAVTGSTCATVAANGSCDMTVTYTPLTGGDTTGTVFLQGQPADGSAALNGLGYLEGYGTGSGTLQVTGLISPLGVLSFGQVASGQTSTQVVTLTNPVTAAAGTTITVRRLLSEFPFLSTTTCGTPLAPGQSCTVTLTYAPLFQATASTQPQMNNGVLTIETDGANSPLFVDLAGQATPAIVTMPVNTAPLSAFTLSEGSLTFPATAVGSSSAAQTVTITNTGTTTLHVLKLVTQSSFTASNGCGGAIPAGVSCSIGVSFAPQAMGSAMGSLEIQTDSGAVLEFVSLLGTGSAAGANAPSVSVSPVSVDFGRVLVGGTGSAFVTVANTGAVDVNYAGAAVTGGVFALAASSTAGNPCPAAGGTLVVGASCRLAVVFAPVATGTFNGSAAVSTSATTVPLTVALSGVGTQPLLAVSPTSLAFGTVVVGSSGTLGVTLRNTGTTPVDGLTFAVTAGYSVSTTCGLTTIQAGATCTVSVTFTPTGNGVVAGTLTIASTDPASPLTVPLTGNGVVPGSFTLTVNGGATATVTVQAGSAANFALAITPTGGYSGVVALTCTADALVPYTACSLLPSTVTLTSGTQTATATVGTIATANAVFAGSRGSDFDGGRRGLVLAFLPLGIAMVAGRRRHKLARLLVLLVGTVLLCGGCGAARSDIRYASPGTYTFHVTATSTNTIPVTQTVAMTVVVTQP